MGGSFSGEEESSGWPIMSDYVDSLPEVIQIANKCPNHWLQPFSSRSGTSSAILDYRMEDNTEKETGKLMKAITTEDDSLPKDQLCLCAT